MERENMNKPSFTSPWFVVQKIEKFSDHESIMTYYSTEEEEFWTIEIDKAFVFTNLKSASRIALEQGAEVRVILKETELK